jgi:hypothetical protein
VAERLYCSMGHSWTPAFPPDVWPPDFRTSCPVCGAGPIGPLEMTVTTARVVAVVNVLAFLIGLLLVLVSENTLPFGIFSLIIAGVMLFIWLGMYIGRQKRKKMAGIAEAMGFSFVANLLVSSVRALAPFRLFTLGHSQKACNAMQGRVGDCDVLYFEYQYTVGSGKSAHTTTVSSVLLFEGAAGVPDFQLAPKTFFDKIVGFFSHNSIELEDAGEFAARCKLSGPDPAALRETFHPDLVHYLGRDGRWFIQALDEQLLLYRTPVVQPDRCPGLVTDALEIRDLLRGAGRRAF